MYHTLCLSFVRFESMDVIRGNFRLATEEQPSNKDGGGLEHGSGEFMHQLRSLQPGILIIKVPQRNEEVFGFQSQNLFPLNLFHKPVPENVPPGGQPALGDDAGGAGERFLGARSDQEMLRPQTERGEEKQPWLCHLCHERGLQSCIGEENLK